MRGSGGAAKRKYIELARTGSCSRFHVPLDREVSVSSFVSPPMAKPCRERSEPAAPKALLSRGCGERNPHQDLPINKHLTGCLFNRENLALDEKTSSKMPRLKMPAGQFLAARQNLALRKATVLRLMSFCVVEATKYCLHVSKPGGYRWL